jgi:dihydropteroate synthase
MLEKARARRGVALMGVCNITPDSFSDGGRHYSEEGAIGRIDSLISEGADIIDIGGESTRPGAEPVEAREQIRRVLPAVRHAIAKGACVSIDTTDVGVATACLEAGVHVVNDVSCLRDPALARVAKDADAAFVLMHSRGTPADMQTKTTYDGDLITAVVSEWRFAAERANAQGLSRQALVMDPGIGFAKTAEQSIELLARTRDLVTASDVPVLIGASRKSFLKSFDKDATAEERIGGSVAAALFAARAGAAILRVHDVRATVQAIDVFRRLEGGT